MDQKAVKQANSVLLAACRNFTADVCGEFSKPGSACSRRMQVLHDVDPDLARAVAMDAPLQAELEDVNKE